MTVATASVHRDDRIRIHRHASTSTPHPVTSVDREPVDAVDVVRVLWFIMSFSNDSNKYTVTVEVSGEMLDCSGLDMCGGVDRRCADDKPT